MRLYWLIIVLFFFASCATHRSALQTVKHPHTAEVRRATMTITADKESHTVNATLQAVHDSVVVVSVQPLLSIELIHLKATKDSLFLADRIHRQRTQLSYKDLNRYLHPNLFYHTLEDMVFGKWFKSGEYFGKKTFHAGKHTVTLQITSPDIRLDEPIRIKESRSEKYESVDWHQILTILQL